jgi:hypothetical protein
VASRAEAILGRLGQQDSESIALLERLANQDSGTYDRAAVNRMGDKPAIANDAGSGLGAVGSTMDSSDEYVEVSSLRERVALLALFMETWYERI